MTRQRRQDRRKSRSRTRTRRRSSLPCASGGVAAATDLPKLADSGDGQISRTDPDARLLAKHGQIVAGYNVQIDDKHKLIVASEVVNDGNDTGQLHAMAATPKQLSASRR
jgi:hypothetical protein